MAKTLLLIVNPKAGRTKSSFPLFEAAAHICENGYMISIRFTQEQGHATRIIEAEGADYDAVVCCGGDGTLNETVSGLMGLTDPPPLGYIPCGSTNDFAASLGLKDDPLANAQTITASHGIRLDTGTLNGRPFVYVASFGAFTRVSYAAPQAAKNDLGHLAYILEGVKDLSSLRPYKAKVETDEECFEGDFLFGAVTNSTSVGGLMKLSPEKVILDDGLFELLLIRMPTSIQELHALVHCLVTQEPGEGVIFRHIPSLRVFSEEAFPWTVDGEYCQGAEQIDIKNLPRRLTFLV